MKLGWHEILLVVGSMIWVSVVIIQYLLIDANDCTYTLTDACRAYMYYQPRLVLWRGAAVELLIVAVYLWFRKL